MATVKKIKKAQDGKKLLTPARTREVADSLDFEARKKVYSKINKTTKVDDSGNYDKYKKSVENYNLKADKEFKKSPDMINAKRYRSLADKAEGKKQKNGGSTPAWQRKEGKNPSGGLNAKGRASYNRANPGKPGLKAPQPQGGPRKRSFCARMSGVKGPATKPNGEPTRKTLALRKWKC
jgi:hypothetical protein